MKIAYKNQTYEVVNGLTIGRMPDNHIITDKEDKFVSRHHARIGVEAEVVYIADLNSKNGTFVNNKKVDGKEQINIADKIILGGDTILEVLA